MPIQTLTAGAWAACGVIICASLLPVRVISRLQHPDIGANSLKTWMLSDTTYLGFRPLLLYFLPQLPDFRTTNTFMSCRHWFHTRSFNNLHKTPSEAQIKKNSVAFF